MIWVLPMLIGLLIGAVIGVFVGVTVSSWIMAGKTGDLTAQVILLQNEIAKLREIPENLEKFDVSEFQIARRNK